MDENYLPEKIYMLIFLKRVNLFMIKTALEK